MQVHSETDPDAGAARRPMSVVVVAPHPDDAELGMGGTIARLVDEGHAAVAFSLSPVTVEELMEISDANEIMPPKSTWFEPKLRDGLLSHLI